MDTIALNKLIRALGIPLGAIALALIIIGLFVAYRNYRETVKLNLEIKQLKLELA